MGELIGAWFERDMVRASGPDAARFLQGQLSQDVEAMGESEAAWSFVLDPDGKLVAWVRIRREGADVFLLDVAQGCGQVVLDRLNRFRIRVACELESLGPWPMLALRGDAAALASVDVSALLGPDGVAVPPAGGSVGVEGLDLLCPALAGGDLSDALLPEGLLLDAAAVHAERVRMGVPEMGAELDDSTIPAEIGTWFVEEAVSWTKGCYTGQELVARLDSRGSNTPRRLRFVDLSEPSGVGAEVIVDERVVGALTSVAGEAALALVARSVVPPASVAVDGRPATVREIPGTAPKVAATPGRTGTPLIRRTLN